MLTQLIEELSKTNSLLDKFLELEHKAKTIPTSSEDLLELIKLSKYRISAQDLEPINQPAIQEDITNCKQLLIFNDDYFYI